MIDIQKTYQRWGKSYRLRFMPYNSGVFVSGYEVYAYIMRVSDGAFFDFYSYDANPNNDVWLTTGSFPGDLTHLRKLLPEFKIGTIKELAQNPDRDVFDNFMAWVKGKANEE